MGLGLACAEAFAHSGAMTVLADINFPERQAAEIVKAGCKAAPYRCDVSDETDVKHI